VGSHDVFHALHPAAETVSGRVYVSTTRDDALTAYSRLFHGECKQKGSVRSTEKSSTILFYYTAKDYIMNLNLKQQELVQGYIARIQERFPEVEFRYLTPSAEDPQDIWVHLLVPDNDDESIELGEFSAKMSIDILVDYGYSISIMTHPFPVETAEEASYNQ
jgi:hypothetical protein